MSAKEKSERFLTSEICLQRYVLRRWSRARAGSRQKPRPREAAGRPWAPHAAARRRSGEGRALFLPLGPARPPRLALLLCALRRAAALPPLLLCPAHGCARRAWPGRERAAREADGFSDAAAPSPLSSRSTLSPPRSPLPLPLLRLILARDIADIADIVGTESIGFVGTEAIACDNAGNEGPALECFHDGPVLTGVFFGVTTGVPEGVPNIGDFFLYFSFIFA